MSQQGTDLPSPDQRPDADVVIYDGHCNFCRSQAAQLAKWDPWGRLAFLSLHDEEVGRRWRDLSHEQMMKQMIIIDGKGNRYFGATSLRYLSRRLPRLWPLAPLLHLPGSLWFWQWCYRQLSQRRYRIQGSQQPPPGPKRL